MKNLILFCSLLFVCLYCSSCYKTAENQKYCWTCTINQRTYNDSATIPIAYDTVFNIQKCDIDMNDIQIFEQTYTLVGTVNMTDTTTGKVYTYQVANVGASCTQNL